MLDVPSDDTTFDIIMATLARRAELEQADKDEAEAAVAKDLVERGLTRQLLQVEKPRTKRL
jgi:hypothetical protein